MKAMRTFPAEPRPEAPLRALPALKPSRRNWREIAIAAVVGALVAGALTFAVQQVRLSNREAALGTATAQIEHLTVLRQGLVAYRDYLLEQYRGAVAGQVKAEQALRHALARLDRARAAGAGSRTGRAAIAHSGRAP